MDNRNRVTINPSGGIGLLGVLQIVFIVLKLTDLISWPWLVVLIPLWIEIVGIIIMITIICIFVHKEKKRKNNEF